MMLFREYYLEERNDSNTKSVVYAEAVIEALRLGRIIPKIEDNMIRLDIGEGYPATYLNIIDSGDGHAYYSEDGIHILYIGRRSVESLYTGRGWYAMLPKGIGRDISEYMDSLSEVDVRHLREVLNHEATHHYDYELYKNKGVGGKILDRHHDSMKSMKKRIMGVKDSIEKGNIPSIEAMTPDELIWTQNPYYRNPFEMNAFFSGFLSKVRSMGFADALVVLRKELWYKALRPKDRRSMEKRLYQSLSDV